MGHDGDVDHVWRGTGVLTGPDTLKIDLSSKNGPAALEGKWSGTGIIWTSDGGRPIRSDGRDNWPK